MTKKHYEAIAKAIRTYQPDDSRYYYDEVVCDFVRMCEQMADFFQKDNPKFDRTKFLESCGAYWPTK